MMAGNSRKQIKALLVACIGAAVMCLYSAQARCQNLPNAVFRPTIEDVDPGIDHGNSYRNLPETYQKQAVFYRSQEPPGTIIVETSERHLYLIESETRALRYGIGKISRKGEWPDWHPPREMIERNSRSRAYRYSS
jgi:lipoprotein-anchoring transpeptidase ErfK/SrfK